MALVCWAGHIRKNADAGRVLVEVTEPHLGDGEVEHATLAALVGDSVSASGASIGSIASNSLVNVGCVLRLVSTVWMKPVANGARCAGGRQCGAEPPAARSDLEDPHIDAGPPVDPSARIAVEDVWVRGLQQPQHAAVRHGRARGGDGRGHRQILGRAGEVEHRVVVELQHEREREALGHVRGQGRVFGEDRAPAERRGLRRPVTRSSEGSVGSRDSTR